MLIRRSAKMIFLLTFPFIGPLHPRGRLISYSSKRPQKKERQLIGTITRTNGKRDCVFWKPACQLRDSTSRKTRGLTRSLGPANTLNGRPKISLSEVFRVDNLRLTDPRDLGSICCRIPASKGVPGDPASGKARCCLLCVAEP
jgi:hypothetical protein